MMDAYAKSKTPDHEKDRRGTPVEIFECIQDFLGVKFTLDVCADQGNFKVCNYLGLDIGINSLADDVLWNGISWMNPVYSNPGPWCEKASKMARENGAVVVGLLPDDRSTGWFKDFVYPFASAIYTTSRRIPFLDENGVPQNGNPKGSIIPVWTPWRVDAPAGGYIQVPKYNQRTGVWSYE